MTERQYSFWEFREIIKALRSENGCPWDKEQTHESLRSCMTEEAAELVASIRIYKETGCYENMREELGDVLLQVVMHSTIAEEEGLFTFEDVVTDISQKMIRRHPHVFGTAFAETSDQVLKNWEEIKKEEKKGQSWAVSPLRDIPREFPALTRAAKVFKKVDKLYEKQPDAQELGVRLKEQAAELERAVSGQTEENETEKLLGEVLLTACALSARCRFSPEQILTDRAEDLIEVYEGR